jgi:hypothetical protein
MTVAETKMESTAQDVADSAAWPTLERRATPRFAVDAPASVQVGYDGPMFRGRIVNLSLTGCYIQTIAGTKIPADTAVEIEFLLMGVSIQLSALFKWSKPKAGMGFRFIAMEKDSRMSLEEMLRELQNRRALADLSARVNLT